jgi:hypothetical protein
VGIKVTYIYTYSIAEHYNAILLDVDNNGYRNSKNGIGHAVRTDERVRGEVPDLAIRAGFQTQCGRNSPLLSPQIFRQHPFLCSRLHNIH